MTYIKGESIAPKKRLEREAVNLAMQNQWEEAVEKNRAILESFPGDVDAFNRLGRGLMELGRYAEARDAYGRTLALDPHNSIAKKNLSRLSQLGEGVARASGGRLAPQLFVGETGKVGVVNLQATAPQQMLARMAPGDEVRLVVKGLKLNVETPSGEYLGEVDPVHGPRLAKLIQGGNGYIAAVSRLGEQGVKVVVKEVYQHPSQEGKLSFPAKDTEGFRAYVRESLLRTGEGEEAEEPEYVPGAEEEEEEERESLPHGFSFVGGVVPEEEE